MWFDESTVLQLGWDEILAQLAGFAVTPQGRGFCLKVRPLNDIVQIQSLQQRCKQIARIFDHGATSPLEPIEEIETDLLRAKKGGTLQADAVLRIGHAMRVSSRVRRFILDQGSAEVNQLIYLAHGTHDLESLSRDLLGAFDPDGQLRDSASPDLARLRKTARNLADNIRSRLTRMIHKSEVGAFLREPYFTQRGDRYVLPIRADAPESFPGIVHDTSQSGATLFIEPAEMIEEGNRLKIAQAAVLDEERRILLDYSGEIAEQVDGLRQNLGLVAEFDRLAAAVALGRKLNGNWVELGGDGFDLHQVRHPLMVLSDENVVPNHIQLLPEQRCLVITGPNAGGKTVILKSVGLIAMMTQAGLPVPVAEGSKIECYSQVWAIIGDAQDIHQGLSTFSAHIMGLAEIFRCARAGSLVLLDELTADTEPRHGASLACAICTKLCDMGVTTLVSTHYEELKRLAYQNERIVNVSVGFDLQTREPSYQLHLDMPGSSLTFNIARRFQIPESVLHEAGSYLDGSEHMLDRVLEGLENDRQMVLELRQELADKTEKANRLSEQLDCELDKIKTQRNEIISSQCRQLLLEIEQARKETAGCIEGLKRNTSMKSAVNTSQTLKDLEQHVEKMHAENVEQLPEPCKNPEQPDNLSPGDHVFVTTLGQRGQVISIDTRAGMVAVRLGSMLRTRVSLEQVQKISAARISTSRHKQNDFSAFRSNRDGLSGQEKQSVVRTVDNTIDLRGLRGDEAVDCLDKFLDETFGQAKPLVFIVHGHGSGLLKSRLRDYLRTSPYPEHFRSGTPDEGGDGVTVVKMK